MARRIVRGILVLLVASTPLLAALILIRLSVATPPEPEEPPATPNPAKAPWYFLGPQEILVRGVPEFAGSIIFWICPWLLILCAFAIFAAATATRLPIRRDTPSIYRLSTQLIISLVLGVVFATPWFWAVIFRR